MSEFSMFAEFETEIKAQEALWQLRSENLPKLGQQNRFFHFVVGAKPNQNPRVVEVLLDYYISWAIPQISDVLWPIAVTSKMEIIWERPAEYALGATA